MGFKVIGGKVQKKVRKQPDPLPPPPEFVGFKFELPADFRPDITDDEARRVLAATFQAMAENLMQTEGAETFRANKTSPQEICESIVELHRAGLLELGADGDRVPCQLRDPTIAKRIYNS